MNNALMHAILSMDAYNRGYEAGLKFGNEEKIGTAYVLEQYVFWQ